MRLLAVVSKLTGVSTNVEASEVTLNTPSIVKLSAQREEISQLARVNQDLVITFHSGEKMTIKNFYVTNDQGASQLVLEDDNGALWWVENPEAGLQFEQISSIDELLITAGGANEGAAIWPWVLGGVVAAGGIAAIAASGGGGGDDDDNGSGNPGGGTDTGGGGTDNGGGGTTNPPPGSVDTTPPASPLITSALDAVAGITGAIQNGQTTNDNQPVLFGTGEVGAVITVYDNGQVLGTTTVDASGNWNFKPPSSLVDGEHELTVTATDKAGNTSIVSGEFSFVVDTVPPAAVSGLTISEDGLFVSGTAEAGSTVTLLDNQQNTLATFTVDESGTFTVRLTSAQTNSEQLVATITDAAGNSGPNTPFFGSDSGFPDAPDITGIIDDTESTAVTLTDGQFTNDTTPTLTGTAESGAVIKVYENGVEIGSVTAVNGTWSLPLNNVIEGQHTYTATQTTANGTSGDAETFSITVDITAPDAPGDLQVSPDGSALTGSAEAGSTVTIANSDGATLGIVTAGSDGKFTFPLSPALVNGEVLTAVAIDKAGNPGASGNATAPDTTAPQPAGNLNVSDDGATVTGTAEPGST
ncbi:TPA: BapA prefix-like domain-containing protein, partial [Citrobacter sedlakii]|nr:BapA prefix-like domain-containing protein [Citrobacter sedlakii]